MNVDLRTAADVDWLELYDEWAAAIAVQYAAQREAIEASGPLTRTALRTYSGERTMSPRWARDGRTLYYVEASADRRPWLRRIHRETGADADVHDLGGSGEIARPCPAAAYFSRAAR